MKKNIMLLIVCSFMCFFANAMKVQIKESHNNPKNVFTKKYVINTLYTLLNATQKQKNIEIIDSTKFKKAIEDFPMAISLLEEIQKINTLNKLYV